MNIIKSKKYYLKGLAETIRQTRDEYKDAQRNGDYHLIIVKLNELYKLKYEYRHQHIAYCLAKKSYATEVSIYNGDDTTLNNYGKFLYKKIENKIKDYNEPNFKYIRQLVDEYIEVQEIQDEKTVCSDSQ